MRLSFLNQIAFEDFAQIEAVIVGVIETAHVPLSLILCVKDVFQCAGQPVSEGCAHTFRENASRHKLRVSTVFDRLLCQFFDRIQKAVVIIIIGGCISGQ